MKARVLSTFSVDSGLNRYFVELDRGAPLACAGVHRVERLVAAPHVLLALEQRDAKSLAGLPVDEHEHLRPLEPLWGLLGVHLGPNELDRLVDPGRVALEGRYPCVHVPSSLDPLAPAYAARHDPPMSTFPGIIPAVVVPFGEDDSIDVDALRSNTGHLIDGGVHGLVVNGTMGEAGALSDDERGLVIDTIVELAGGRLPVTVGVSSASTRASCAFAEQARDRGAQGVMCLPPLLYPGTTEELVAHFTAVSDTAGLPVMAYNNPEASGIDLTPERIATIASAVPGVVGVKECS